MTTTNTDRRQTAAGSRGRVRPRTSSPFRLAALALTLGAMAVAAPLHASPPLPSGWFEVRSSDSYVGYRIHKLGMVPVRGQFGAVRGRIFLDPEDPERSRASIRVPLESLESGKEERNETLLSDDFFDAADHPEMRFESRQARHREGRWLVSGDLTIRGVTRTVTVPVTIEAGEGIEGPVVVFSTHFEIDRTEFGVLGNRWSGGRDLISDEVRIEIALTAE